MGKPHSATQLAGKIKYSPVTICKYCKQNLIPGAQKNSKGQWEIPDDTYQEILANIGKIALCNMFKQDTDNTSAVTKNNEWDVRVSSEQIKYLNKQKATSKEQSLYLYLLTIGGSYTEMQPLNTKEIAAKLSSTVSGIYSLMSSMDTKHIVYTLHNFTDQITYRLIKPTQDCYSETIKESEALVEASALEPESEPILPSESELSTMAGMPIQDSKCKCKNINILDLINQAKTNLKTALNIAKYNDMPEVYTRCDDALKDLNAINTDSKDVNSFTFMLAYPDDNSKPYGIVLKFADDEGAVA